MRGMKWEHSIIKEIFSKKQSEKSEDRDNLLRLTSHQLYGEKIHYALELIQNAEDENSPSITFVFNNDSLFVINDGRSFDEKDVWRICSVKPGEKKKKIGFFGIGFKSVFNITEKPQIISGKYNFEIEEYIYPKAKTSFPSKLKSSFSPDKGAIFILPYSVLSTPKELIDNFNMIDDKILLFLESLNELQFIDNINNNKWILTKKKDDSIVSLINMRVKEETKWSVFHQILGVEAKNIAPEGKEGIKETRITIAFPLDSAVRDKIKNSGVVYCYLPTKKRTDLPFLIQADFLPTIGRENISEHPWNIWLLKELGILAAEAIDKIKNDKRLSSYIYNFIPISEEVPDPLIRHLFEPFFTALKEKQIAITTKGWMNPNKCVIPDDERLRNLLTEKDLKVLFNREVFYIEPGFSERTKDILLELGSKPIGPKEVIEFLKNEQEINKKSKEWFLNLYEYLSTVFDITKKSFLRDFPWDWGENIRLLFKKLESTKFILTENNKIVPLKDSKISDRLICYPQRINLSEVNQLFTRGEIVFLNRYFQESSIVRRKTHSKENEEKRRRVKDWFDNIGVKKYFKQSHIIKQVILKKFTTRKYREYSDQQLYGFVNYIRKYWSIIESEIKNKKISADIVKQIKSEVLLKAFKIVDGKKINEYKCPEEIYFSKRYGKIGEMEELFDGIEDIHFISSYYLNREKRERRKTPEKTRGRKRVEYTWRKFFEILGIWGSPRVQREREWISISGKKGYEWVEKRYSPRYTHEIYGDSHSDDIKKLIQHCSKINNKSNIQKRMRILWKSLEKNWKFYKSKYCTITYKWFYHSEQTKDYETSSFLEFLKNAKWVLGDDGGFYQPKDVFTNTKLNQFLLGDDAQFVSLEADDIFLKDLGIRINPEIEEVIAHLKNYKENNPKPAENKIEKMNTIYIFLKNKINEIKESEIKSIKIKEIQDIFCKNELLYLPREDKSWWKPIYIFWEECSDVFGTLRGYIEHEGIKFYNIDLKEFFLYLGLVEKPFVKECLDVLEEIKGKENLELYKGVMSRAYTYLNDVVKQGLTSTNWDRNVFLSEKGNFLKPSELYFNDNDEYKKYFGDKLQFLFLEFSWSNVKEFLNAAKFRRLSQHITVVKKFSKIDEVEGDATNQLIQRLEFVENYIKKNNVELHRELQREGVFKKVKELQAFETPEIVLDYFFKKDDLEPMNINNVNKDAYLSVQENRIYISNQLTLLSTPVAKELSMLFTPGQDYVFPLLDSLFGPISDEELSEKLEHFGIPLETITEEPHDVVKVIPSDEKEQEPQKRESKRKKKRPKSISEKVDEKPQLPTHELKARRLDLINPDEFVFDTAEEHTPYIKTEGPPTLPKKTIKLRKGYPEVGKKRYQPRERVSRMDAEATALEIVMRLEEFEEREPEDRHKQPAIGYDIYSKTIDEKERFIEVKHFRGDPGTFTLTAHQWKKAETEKEKYFVYVVSGLREGDNLAIEMIQNPVKFLMPEPPLQRKFTDWNHGVRKVVRCRKV